RGRRLYVGWCTEKATRMLKYSAGAWTSAIGSAVFGQCDQLVVGGLLGAPMLGVYAAITGITSKINSFSGAAVQPLVPALNGGNRSRISVVSRLQEAAQLNAFIAIEIGVIL